MPQKITDAEKAAYLDRTTELFNRAKNGTLSMSAVLAGLQKLIEGKPFAPGNWSIVEHREGGVIDPGRIALYISEEQKKGGVRGDKLREELKIQPVLNATHLDWLLKPENQHLIPESWKQEGRYVFFWGTIFRNEVTGNECVRYLFWNSADCRWCTEIEWIGCSWHRDDLAAVLQEERPAL